MGEGAALARSSRMVRAGASGLARAGRRLVSSRSGSVVMETALKRVARRGGSIDDIATSATVPRSRALTKSTTVEVQFIQEARGGGVKPAGFVTPDDLTGLSATEANIRTAAEIAPGTKIELITARIPRSSLKVPLSGGGHRLFVPGGRSLSGIREFVANPISPESVISRQLLGEVQPNILQNIKRPPTPFMRIISD